METRLDTPIKDLIARCPAVGKILEEFSIGCVPCSVGTCLLSDIVDIHDLSPDDEETLLSRIAGVVSPGAVFRLPEERRNRATRERKTGCSPPMKRLVDEHVLIKRFIALVPALVGATDVSSEAGRKTLLDGVDFIRSYADRFHHAKEEDILFARFDPGLDILKVMHEDHRRGRACVRELVDAIHRGDGEGVSASLRRYSEILSEHIRKEDEILYPWMDRNLSTRQVGELFSKFTEVDGTFEREARRHEAFVIDLENKLSARGAEVAR